MSEVAARSCQIEYDREKFNMYLSGRIRHLTLCLALLGTGLVGCKSWIRPGTDVPQSLNTWPPSAHGSAVLLPGADYHLAIVRRGPPFRQSDGTVFSGQDVLCQEPSPDWAIAFGTAFAGAATGGASGGPSGSVGGSASTTESITAAAGRTAGVVALRDGLYAACEAYANQVIGKDAYSLILSQYGNLLVALAGGGGGSGGAASEGGNSTVPAMQQEAVQAMLVACISYNDWSIPHGRNTLLDNYCNSFMTQLGKALPWLLTPAGAASQTSSGSKQAPAATKHTAQERLAQSQHAPQSQAPTQREPPAKPEQ